MLLNFGVGALLRVPWTARRSNQSILKEISPKNSLEGLILKLKLQYFGHLMQRADLLEKTLKDWERLKAGGDGNDRGRDGWMASSTQWTWGWASSGSWWWTGRPGVQQSQGHRVGHDWVTEQQQQGAINLSHSMTISKNFMTFDNNLNIKFIN